MYLSCYKYSRNKIHPKPPLRQLFLHFRNKRTTTRSYAGMICPILSAVYARIAGKPDLRYIGKIERIERKKCRQHMEERFTIDRMVSDYEKVYEEIFRREADKTSQTKKA